MATRTLDVILTGNPAKMQAAFASAVKGSAGAKVAIGAVAVAAAEAGKALYNIGGEFEHANNIIKAQTGETGKHLSRLEDDFKSVVSQVPASFEEAATAVGELHKRLDLVGGPLRHQSRQFLELSRMTGGDLQGNIKSVARAFEDWDVPVKKQAGTLDQFFVASQKSGISVEALGEQVDKFGPQLRNLHFGLGRSVALFASFEKAGVQNTKVGAALNLAFKNLVDEGIAPKDTGKKVFELFRGMETGAVSAERALEIFGSKSGSAIIQAVEQGRFHVGEFRKELENSGGAILRTGDETKTTSDHFHELGNKLKVLVAPAAEAVYNGVNSLAGALAKVNFRKALHDAGPTLREIGDIIGIVARAIGPTIRQSLKTAAGFFKNFAQVIKGIVEVISGILHGEFSKVWQGVKDIFSGYIKGTLAIFKGMTAPIRAIAGKIGGALADGFSAAWGFVKGIFEDGINDVIGLLNDMIGLIDKVPFIHIGKIGELGGGSEGSTGAPGGKDGGGNLGKKKPGAGVGRHYTGGPITKPMAIVGEEAPCIAESTLIETERGLVPIENVVVDERVMTRNGLRRVVWSGVTRKDAEVLTVTTVRGDKVTCTPDHRIWAQSGKQDRDSVGGGPIRGRGVNADHHLQKRQVRGLGAGNDRPGCGPEIPGRGRFGDREGACQAATRPQALLRGRGGPAASREANARSLSPVVWGAPSGEGAGATRPHRGPGREGSAPDAVPYMWPPALRGNLLRQSEDGLCDLRRVQAEEGPRADAAQAAGPRVQRSREACGEGISAPQAGWVFAEDLAVGDTVWVSGDDGLSPCEIAAIDDAARIDTYDLMVETDHEFIAGGILVHNSHPEWVIATNPAYRKNNLAYWAQAGKDLGVPGFSGGGLFEKATSVAGDVVDKAKGVASSVLGGGASSVIGALPTPHLPGWMDGSYFTKAASEWIKKQFAGRSEKFGKFTGLGGAGTVPIDGYPVADWIAKILLSARKAGIDFSVSSGYRSYAEQKAIFDSGVRPAAVPGTSHHEGLKYPDGAVDISPGATNLAGWLSHTRWRKALIYAGAKDPVHFSHPFGGGYAKGGRIGRFLGAFKEGGKLPGWVHGSGTLSADQLASLAHYVGAANPGLMAQIAQAESGGNPHAMGGAGDKGLWQIIPSTAAAFGIPYGQLYDPLANAIGMKKILDGQGLGAWSTYNSGAYASESKGTVSRLTGSAGSAGGGSAHNKPAFKFGLGQHGKPVSLPGLGATPLLPSAAGLPKGIRGNARRLRGLTYSLAKSGSPNSPSRGANGTRKWCRSPTQRATWSSMTKATRSCGTATPMTGRCWPSKKTCSSGASTASRSSSPRSASASRASRHPAHGRPTSPAAPTLKKNSGEWKEVSRGSVTRARDTTKKNRPPTKNSAKRPKP
jgi:phage-related minor tail protein